MTGQNIMRIDCYGRNEFVIGKTKYTRDELYEYCQKQFSNGSKPETIQMFFIRTCTIPEIADWKKQTLDALIK